MIELFEAIHHQSMLIIGFSTDGLITILAAVFCLNFILYTKVRGGVDFSPDVGFLILISSFVIVIFPIYSILVLILVFILYFIAKAIKPEEPESSQS